METMTNWGGGQCEVIGICILVHIQIGLIFLGHTYPAVPNRWLVTNNNNECTAIKFTVQLDLELNETEISQKFIDWQLIIMCSTYI